MYILGIGYGSHDASASLLKDGQIVAAAEEERFTRIKHCPSFPQNAIDFCLKRAGISANDIDHIAHWWDYSQFTFKKFIYGLRYLRKNYKLLRYETFRGRLNTERQRFVERCLGITKPVCHHFVTHHTAHAASAYYPSGFDEAAVLSIDGRGEWECTVLYYANEKGIEKLKQIFFPHSLGIFYSTFTSYLGFEIDSDEYKVMGLAPYGEPAYKDAFEKIVRLRPEGNYELDLDYFKFHYRMFPKDWFSPKVEKIFGPRRYKDDLVEQRHANVACSLQKRLEDAELHVINHLYKLTKCKNLCIAGGVGLNCVANGRILRETPFENIFIQPAANDAGTSLGAALYAHNQILGGNNHCNFTDAYLGPEYSNDEIKKNLDLCKISYTYCEDPGKVAARFIADGRIVGWFQGRMEFGPRALGNRSILADPRRKEMKDIVNKAIKYREEFRPFAPAVVVESARDFFADGVPSSYMLLVTDVLPEKRTVIPAITHKDGTARLQTVSRETNPRFHELISEFGRITGVPVVLNTSFNVKGEPIVCTPSEAIRCFYSTGLDVLILGNYLIQKNTHQKLLVK